MTNATAWGVAVYVCAIAILTGSVALAAAQDFTVEETLPAHGASDVDLSKTIVFTFNDPVSITTNWNTAFPRYPRDALQSNRVELCLNPTGTCDAGDDHPRHVRYHAAHQADTDYTWVVYDVETVDGQAMSEPHVLRYSTASTLGQATVSGMVEASGPAAWSPQVAASLRDITDGLQRSELGQLHFQRLEEPVVDTDSPTDDLESLAGKQVAHTASESDHTLVYLLDSFSPVASEWTVRAADVITGSSGAYAAEFVRDGTYWPLAIRYADGARTEIEALGFHDADGDGTPDPVTIDGASTMGNIDLTLFDFPLTTAQDNLDVAYAAAANVAAGDATLKHIVGGNGIRPTGMAHAWSYVFYDSNEAREISVTVDPLGPHVDVSSAPPHLGDMHPVPEDFLSSDEALAIALTHGGQELVDGFRPQNVTTMLRGGHRFWADPPVPSATFWDVHLVGVSPSQISAFTLYLDMSTGDVLDRSDRPGVPAPPVAFAGAAGDGEVTLTWTSPDDPIGGYHLYRRDNLWPRGYVKPRPEERIAQLDASTEMYVDTDLINSREYFYRLTAVNADNAESSFTDVVSAFPYPETVALTINRPFGDPTEARNYRLVGLPGRDVLSVSETLPGNPGTDWAVYRDDGSPENALQPYDGSSAFQFGEGRGFWMLSRDPWQPSRDIETVRLNADGTYAVDLHDGWNIIANPFDTPLDWNRVRAANNVTQLIWQWDGSYHETTTFSSAREGEAFYFFNAQGLDQLHLPYPGAPRRPSSAHVDMPPPQALTLTASLDGERVSSVRLGQSRSAALGVDAHTQFAPPGAFTAAQLRIANGDVNSRYPYLSADFRPLSAYGHVYTLELEAPIGRTTQIAVEGAGAIDTEELLLIHPATGATYNLRATSSLELQPRDEMTTWVVLAGSQSFVRDERAAHMPATVELLPGYPNPFHAYTTLTYTLPATTATRLTIYDISGRRVRTLVDADLESGRHTVQWNGRNEAGRPVASGVYFGRLEAGGQRDVQRLVLVR